MSVAPPLGNNWSKRCPTLSPSTTSLLLISSGLTSSWESSSPPSSWSRLDSSMWPTALRITTYTLSHLHWHYTPHSDSVAFRHHVPPNSARFNDATERALFISAQLSTGAVSALRKVWVLIIMTVANVHRFPPSNKSSVSQARICLHWNAVGHNGGSFAEISVFHTSWSVVYTGYVLFLLVWFSCFNDSVCVLIDWLMITYIALFSALLSRFTALAYGSTCVTSFLIARFLNIHRSGVLTALAWLVPHETAAVSAQVLCTPYNHALCHFMQSHIRKVYACLAVTCHLHFWQNDRDLLRATAVTRGWNGYRN